MRILTLLKDRDLNNHDIRQMTGWNRKKVHQIIKELEPSGIKIIGKGRGSKYTMASRSKKILKKRTFNCPIMSFLL